PNSDMYSSPHHQQQQIPPPQQQQQSSLPPSQHQQQQQQAPPPSQQQQYDGGYSSALKEGYKDETFGTPDLSLLTKPTTAIKEEDALVESGDLQSSWYD